MEDVKEAMNKLPEKYYDPFMLYFEGYKYEEIADNLSAPIGTIKTRIHTARKLLKKTLKAHSFVMPSIGLI